MAKRALDRVRGPQVPPVLGGVVVERGQRDPVAVELGERLRVLGAELLAEDLERLLGVLAGWRFDDLVEQPLRARLQPLGEGVDHVPRGVKPAALLARAGNTSRSAAHAPRAPSPTTSLGSFMPRRLRSRNTPGPALGRLAVAVLDREQLLDPVLPHADHDQQAHLRVLAEADLDVDPVHEQVRVAAEAQEPLAEPVVMRLPLLAQPADRRRRQARGVLAEQPFERRAEVAGREAAEVQDRDHLPDLRRPSRVRRQDPRAELLPMPGVIVDALVVDPRRAQRERPRPNRHATLPRPAVADHQPMPLLVDLLLVPGDVLIRLGPSAAAIIRRAPSRASSSSASVISSLPSPTGSLRTSDMACLPFPPSGGRS